MIWLGSFWSRPPGKPPIVSIAKWSPSWFSGQTLRELAPETAAGEGIGHYADRQQWIESYKCILSERGRVRRIHELVDELLSAQDDMLLACWCKVGRFRQDGSYSGSFCHRLLAGRLLSGLGYDVEVIDLECPQCRGSLSFDGGVISGKFVCRGCRQRP